MLRSKTLFARLRQKKASVDTQVVSDVEARRSGQSRKAQACTSRTASLGDMTISWLHTLKCSLNRKRMC